MLAAYYDLATSPPTYDVVAFLMAAERHRRARGEEWISLNVLPGPAEGFRQDKYWPHTARGRNRMLHSVILPMMRMLPSAGEVVNWPQRPGRAMDWSIGWNSRLYGTRLFVECMKAGIRPLRPSEDRPRDPGLVTITLREAEHWPERNSNVSAWIAAAREIERRGYHVVIVRDSLRAAEKIDGLKTSITAALDFIERAELYRSAACNLFVNNGPAWFAMALDAPVLMLKPTVEGLMRTCSAEFFRQCGVPVGGQIPGAPDYQQIVWADDVDAAAIVAAFDQFANALEDA